MRRNLSVDMRVEILVGRPAIALHSPRHLAVFATGLSSKLSPGPRCLFPHSQGLNPGSLLGERYNKNMPHERKLESASRVLIKRVAHGSVDKLDAREEQVLARAWWPDEGRRVQQGGGPVRAADVVRFILELSSRLDPLTAAAALPAQKTGATRKSASVALVLFKLFISPKFISLSVDTIFMYLKQVVSLTQNGRAPPREICSKIVEAVVQQQQRNRAHVRAHLCERVLVCVCMYVCVCGRERDRQRDKEREKEGTSCEVET